MGSGSASERAPLAAFVLAGLLACSGGCRPEIGDACSSVTDCSAAGDRLCDVSQPEGYCTIFSCEPDTCPDSSVCVGFGQTLDPACEPAVVDPRWPRFERTFCMAACESDDDCREGYVCRAPEDYNAVGVDRTSELQASRVCFVASSSPTVEPSPSCP